MTSRWKQECQKEADAFLCSITALGSTPHKELLRAPAKMKSAFPISTSNSGGCFWLDSATGKPTVNRAGHWGRTPSHQGKSEAAFHAASTATEVTRHLSGSLRQAARTPPLDLIKQIFPDERFHYPSSLPIQFFFIVFFRPNSFIISSSMEFCWSEYGSNQKCW